MTLPDTGHAIKSEFQIEILLEYSYAKNIITVNLKFKLN
jgi:hypothetical protein